MNLPYDIARCVGRNMVANADDFIACPDRARCERYLQMSRDRSAGLPDYQGIPVMSNGRDMQQLNKPCDYMIEVAA